MRYDTVARRPFSKPRDSSDLHNQRLRENKWALITLRSVRKPYVNCVIGFSR